MTPRPLALLVLAVGLSACQAPAPNGSAARTWSPAGGVLTFTGETNQPFLHLSTLDVATWKGVSQGRELFMAEWQAAPGPRALLDGLGPQHNANACSACHAGNGRVQALNADGSTSPAILFRFGTKESDEHPVFGAQLQTSATAGQPEGSVTWRSKANGEIEYVPHLNGELGEYHLGPRLAPHLLGMGLLDLVPPAQLLEYADAEDRDGDGISGRPHWVTEEGLTRLGRFGWKAINATLRTQNATAFHQDMGLTSPVHPAENCTSAQSVCSTQPSGGTPEVSEESLSVVAAFMSVLGVPERRMADPTTFNSGAGFFEQVGCAACHRPTLKTGISTTFPALSEQTFYPYTDLLLHDMGQALDDGVREKDAQSQEWRTPPLWGIGLVEAGGGRFLHDGRATTIEQAIGWHGGEALGARLRFESLPTADRAALLAFLKGL